MATSQGAGRARCLFGTQQAATVIEEVCAGRPGTTDTPAASDPAGGRKVVVSGRAATIGADLVDCLVAVGDQVTIVDHTAPGRPDLTYWAVPSAEVDGLVMATAGADEVYHVTGPAIDDGEAERVREACRRNGVQYSVVTIGTHAEPERTDAIEPQIAEPALAYAARSERSSRGETLSGALAGASLAVVLLAGLIPASGTPLISRLLAEGAGILAAGVAWSRGRRSALPIPAVVAAGGALAALWLLLQSTGGLPTLVSGLLFGFFVGVPLARLRLGRGPLPRQAALVATGIILAVAAVAHPAMSWLDAALVVGGPFAILLGRPMPDWSMKRRQLWEVASGAVAVTAVLATWVGANSAGANVADHGSRRSPEVAITFDGITDPATLQRLVATLDGSGTRATFFVPAPMLQTTAQVGTLLLKGHQQLANGADARDWGAWLDPNYSQLSHDQRVFARNLDVCPTFFRSTDGRTPPMMAAAVRRHRMTMVSSDVRVSGRGDSARLVHQVLAHARSGSIIALRLDTDPPAKGTTAKGTAASTVVDAVPAILQGLRVRGLQPVPLDQLLHLAPYTSRC